MLCVQVMFIGNFDFSTAYHPKGFLEYYLASVMALHDGEDCSTHTTTYHYSQYSGQDVRDLCALKCIQPQCEDVTAS